MVQINIKDMAAVMGQKFSQIELAIDSILDTLEYVMPGFADRFKEINYINSVAYLQRDKLQAQHNAPAESVLVITQQINTLLTASKKAEPAPNLYDRGIEYGNEIWKLMLEGKNAKSTSPIKVV